MRVFTRLMDKRAIASPLLQHLFTNIHHARTEFISSDDSTSIKLPSYVRIFQPVNELP